MRYQPTTLLTVIMYLSMFVPVMFLLPSNPESWKWLLLCILIFTVLHVIRYNFLKQSFTSMQGIILLTVQWTMAFMIQLLDGSFVAQIYFFIILGEAAYKASLKTSVAIAVLCYIGFVLGVYFHYQDLPLQEFSFVVPRALEYAMIFGLSYVTQKFNTQSAQLNQAYEQLKRSQSHLEEKILMEERVRLSREIHDTIGHSLTTALVGMEAGKQLVLQNKTTEAVEKLDLVKQQMRNSLENVRKSVRTLHDHSSFIHFEKSLYALLEETRMQAGVQIDAHISSLPSLNALQELTLYRALQEGLTNGIRHGKCTAFQFFLTCKEGKVSFLLQDNGKMPHVWRYGFGLSAMQERVEQLGGELKVTRSVEGGCCLSITMPLHPAINRRGHVEVGGGSG